MNKLNIVNYIIVHHTSRNNDFPFFIKMRHIYLRGWENIGYHYLIGNKRPFTINGKLYVGRPEAFEGAHAIGYNKESLAVCLIGDFDKVSPSSKQMKALVCFLKKKIKQYNIPIESILAHNELSTTTKTCPGKNVNIELIRALCKNNE